MQKAIQQTVNVLLVLAMILGIIPEWALATGDTLEGGDAENTISLMSGTHYIQTVEDLVNVKNDLSGTYYLQNDLDLSHYGNWVPIGNSRGENSGDDANVFTGVFDGQGHSITGLTISDREGRTGLFDVISGGGIVKNLHVEGNVNAKADVVGILAGYLRNGTIRNVFTSGSVCGTVNVGGIVGACGYWGTSVITDCYTTATIESTSNGTVIDGCGGAVGILQFGSKIENCYATGGVTAHGKTSVGGIVGISRNNSTITHCYYSNLNSGGGEYKSVADMKTQSTYQGWDFSNVWVIDSKLNNGYPYLRNMRLYAQQRGEVTIEQESYEVDISVNDTIEVTATVGSGSVTTSASSFELTSSDTSVARAERLEAIQDGSGWNVTFQIQGIISGTATITLTNTADGKSATCNVTVVNSAADEENKIQPKELLYNCWDRNDGDFKITVQWGWNTFKESATVYDNEKAIVALALSRAAEVGDQTVRSMLRELGFKSPMQSNFYNVALRMEIQKPAYTIGHQRVDFNGSSTNIFALVIRGSTDIEDWITDFTAEISNNGFHTAANNIIAEIEPYIIRMRNEYPADETAFFVTGHSLGGATANIIATKLSAYASDEKVFAYTSASPRTSKTADSAGGHIFNTVNCEDVVPRVPTKWPKSWAYRYGEDIPYPGFSRDDPQNVGLYLNYSNITGGKDLKSLMSPTRLNRNYKSTTEDFGRIISIAHSTDVYLAYLLSRPEARQTQHYQIRRTNVLFGTSSSSRLLSNNAENNMPVDVEVYSDSGVLLGRVKSGKIDTSVIGGALMDANLNGITVDMIYEGNYDIRVIGNEETTITYSTEIIDTSTDKVIEKKEFNDVQISNGKRIESSVGNTIQTGDVQLFVVNESGTEISEIDMAGNETILNDYAFESVTVDGSSITANVVHKVNGANVTLIVASYKSNGQFLNANAISKTVADSMEISLDMSNAEIITVFLMDSDLRVLCPKLSKMVN